MRPPPPELCLTLPNTGGMRAGNHRKETQGIGSQDDHIQPGRAPLPPDVREELEHTLATLIREVERFDSALRVEEQRVTARRGVAGAPALRSTRLTDCTMQVTASIREALCALNRVEGIA